MYYSVMRNVILITILTIQTILMLSSSRYRHVTVITIALVFEV